VRILVAGYGRVGRTLAVCLVRDRERLRDRYGLGLAGVVTSRGDVDPARRHVERRAAGA
jgi:homoserine dehydrogenase